MDCAFVATDQPGVYVCSRAGCGTTIKSSSPPELCFAECRVGIVASPKPNKPGCRSCGEKQTLPAWTLAASWYVTLDCPAVSDPGVYLFDMTFATEAHAELESRGWWFPTQGRYEQAELTFERRKDGREKCALQFCGPGCGPRFASGWLPAGAFAGRQELRDQAGELRPVLIEPSHEPA